MKHSSTAVKTGQDTPRLYWVDYLKAIAIVLVTYRHVLLGLESSGFFIEPWLEQLNLIFFSFRMPLFFILSGLFISSAIAKNDLISLIEKKFRFILYPYLIWSFIQLTLQIVLSGQSNSSRTVEDYWYILYQPRQLDQFWYLPALFNATVVFSIIQKKWQPPVYLHFLLGIALYFSAPVFENISMLSDWMSFYLFFALGFWLRNPLKTERVQQYLTNWKNLILVIPVFFGSQYYYLNYPTNLISFLPITLIGCLLMFMVAFLLNKTKRPISVLKTIGEHSLQIYTMHVIVAAISRSVLHKVFHISDTYILLFTGIVVSTWIPIFVYRFFIKDRLFWFLFTYKKNSAAPPQNASA